MESFTGESTDNDDSTLGGFDFGSEDGFDFGNVIGGGDWAEDRIVPDAMRALAAAQPVPVRNPRRSISSGLNSLRKASSRASAWARKGVMTPTLVAPVCWAVRTSWITVATSA